VTAKAGASGITGVILAGGLGRRMGSVDKGLRPLAGRPMVAWVRDRLVPQVDRILVNANRNLDAYGAFGDRVIPDSITGFAGPLAGLYEGLDQAVTPLVVTVPCDSPLLPLDLVARLREALERDAADPADLAVARTGDQPHPVFCLARRTLRPDLAAYLAGGGRKIDTWYARLRAVEVRFDDCPDAFSNVNTPEELAALERQLRRPGSGTQDAPDGRPL
jgi:molybdopterin-guanine dinucleotide biosynthesis protein A